MIVGGLLIIAGLWFTSAKAEQYTAWCDKQVNKLEKKISLLTQVKEQTQEQDICEV